MSPYQLSFDAYDNFTKFWQIIIKVKARNTSQILTLFCLIDLLNATNAAKASTVTTF